MKILGRVNLGGGADLPDY